MRHVLRRFIKMPMFTTVAVATLAIGIGANAAIFSVVEGVLLKPLPFVQAERLVSVDHSALGVGIKNVGSAPFLYFTYRDQNKTFTDIGLWRGDTASITGRAEPREVECLAVTASMLPVLGVSPALGRPFSAADDGPDAPETAILTHGYWQSTFGGSPSAIGQKLMVDGHPTEIIGVMPEHFRFLDRKPELLLPLRRDPAKVFLGNFSYSSVARLRPDVTLAQANADAVRLIPVAITRYPAPQGFNTKMFVEARLAPNLRPLKDALVGEISGTLWILMGTIGLVLLIACANVANLLLVRADGRQQELAIRAALGAGPGRIARELLLESVTLGAIGGAVGLALAYGAVRVLMATAPADLPRLDEIGIDAPVLAFTFAVSIVAGLLFGAIPVLRYVGPQLLSALRAGGRSASSSRERQRARNALVIVQMALALVLLIGSGLMIRTFQALRRVQPGFTQPEQIQTLRISIPESQASTAEATMRMEQAIADRIATIPSVTSVGLATDVPMTGSNESDPLFAEDHIYNESQLPAIRRFRFVAPGFIATMGNRLVAGRDFTWTDLYDLRPVAMVSENLARELWQHPSAAIGKRVRETLKSPWREVVGVVADERDDGVDQKAPAVVLWPAMLAGFEGQDVSARHSLAYVIRSPRAGSIAFVDEVGRAIWSVNPNLPMADVRTMQEIYSRSLARTSFTLVMLAMAGAMALLLGVAGVYGVISYSVSQRTREIGIRIALGARRGEVTRLFVGHGLRLAAIGVACGLTVAFALTRLMSSLLFDVKATDPVTYAAVTIGLVGAAVLASYLPALQAASVDPVQALKSE
jgi:putative ABC transport system permease protein